MCEMRLPVPVDQWKINDKINNWTNTYVYKLAYLLFLALLNIIGCAELLNHFWIAKIFVFSNTWWLLWNALVLFTFGRVYPYIRYLCLSWCIRFHTTLYVYVFRCLWPHNTYLAVYRRIHAEQVTQRNRHLYVLFTLLLWEST